VWLDHPAPLKKKVTQAWTFKGGLIQDSHLLQQCEVQDPATPKNKDDGRTPELTVALPRNCSGWAAVRRELLGNSSTRPNPHWMRVVCCQEQKQKCRS
jgi:hypothetical protein